MREVKGSAATASYGLVQREPFLPFTETVEVI